MRIFGAIGLGLTIVVLKLLVPQIFAALEATLVQFFELSQKILQLVSDHTEADIYRIGF